MGTDTKRIRFLIESRTKKAEAGFTRLNTKFGSMSAGLGKLGTAFAGLFAGRQLLRFFTDSIEKFNIQEQAVKTLDVALGRSTKGLQNYAAELQKVTAFGDEQIIQAQALIAAFIKEDDVIKSVTAAALDFAVAKSIDLSVAADLLTKTIASSTNALSRYGIVVEGAAGSTERAKSAVDAVVKAFGGQAVAQVETFAGATAQLSNNFGDLQEKLIKGVLPALKTFVFFGLKLVDLINNMVDKQKDFTVGLGEQTKYYNEMKNKSEEFLKSESNRLQNLIEGTDERLNKLRELEEYLYTPSLLLELEKSEREDILKLILGEGDAIRTVIDDHRELFEIYLSQYRILNDILTKSGDLSRFDPPGGKTITTPTTTSEIIAGLKLTKDVGPRPQERSQRMKGLFSVFEFGEGGEVTRRLLKPVEEVFEKVIIEGDEFLVGFEDKFSDVSNSIELMLTAAFAQSINTGIKLLDVFLAQFASGLVSFGLGTIFAGVPILGEIFTLPSSGGGGGGGGNITIDLGDAVSVRLISDRVTAANRKNLRIGRG